VINEGEWEVLARWDWGFIFLIDRVMLIYIES